MFIGREEELKELNEKFKMNTSQLIVMYGRRRIGKSELLRHFCIAKRNIYLEGLEGQHQRIQIQNVLNLISAQTHSPLLSKLNLSGWEDVFRLLTEEIGKQKEKLVIVFDEFQWMANLRSPMVSLLKLYWDNHWKSKNVMIVLCGSIATFMVSKVVKSRALYGRISLEISLGGLKPSEARQLLGRRGESEVLQYLMLFGTIPKYLEEIDQRLSHDKNLNKLCFVKNGFFVNEIDKVFFSQFREAQTYKKIIIILSRGNFSLSELSEKIKIKSGGGLKSYLSNLELAGFIRSYTSIDSKGSRNRKYKLFDEFLIFYFKFMGTHQKQISQNERYQLFNLLVTPHWQPWLGIAFETFCLKHAMIIAEAAGFADEVVLCSPFFGSKDNKFQFDLIYQRVNNLTTVCEIKYYSEPVGTNIIPDMEKKLDRIKWGKKQTIKKMLIAPFGADKHLLATKYFHHIVDLNMIFKV